MRTQKIVFRVYRDKAKEYRWSAKRVGDIVADSGEGYTRKLDAIRALRHFVDGMVALKFTIRL